MVYGVVVEMVQCWPVTPENTGSSPVYSVEWFFRDAPIMQTDIRSNSSGRVLTRRIGDPGSNPGAELGLRRRRLCALLVVPR